jgi:hypothetical protein
MHKLRHDREAKALAFLRRRPFPSSALEIGTAAVAGEPRAFAMPRKAKAVIGMSIAIELVRRGLAEPTRENRFSTAGATACPGAAGQRGRCAMTVR